jgi:hypothetical protein
VFRFGAVVGPNSFEQLAALMQQPAAARSQHGARRIPVLTPRPAPAVKVPSIRLPALPKTGVGQVVHELPRVMRELPQKLGLPGASPEPRDNHADVKPLLNYLLGP